MGVLTKLTVPSPLSSGMLCQKEATCPLSVRNSRKSKVPSGPCKQ